jgi:hypothetical protein
MPATWPIKQAPELVGVPLRMNGTQPRRLFDYLKAHGFRVFLCSGGSRNFLQFTPEQTASGSSGAPAETS